MTFEEIFGGRMVLMRAQRHICQNNKYALCESAHGMFFPVFEDSAADMAFLTIEQNLIILENEFEAKKKLKDKRKRRALDRRADRQVDLAGQRSRS